MTEWSIIHLHLFLFYDPTHLFKNVRNNWLTEKTQSLDLHDPFIHSFFHSFIHKFSSYVGRITIKIKILKIARLQTN